MMANNSWRIIIDEHGAVLWTGQVLPLSVAHATVGRPFGDIVNFTNAIISVNPSAVILSAESAPSGTTFELSVA